MKVLDIDLADLEIPSFQPSKALVVREQVGEAVPLRPNAWQDGYDCGTIIDDTQATLTSLIDYTKPDGISGPDFVSLTSANQDDNATPSTSLPYNEDLRGDTPCDGDDVLIVEDVEGEDDFLVSSIGEKRPEKMLISSSSKRQRTSTISPSS